MDKRLEVAQTFGPKLIEGICLTFFDEINLLRAKHGLPPRTLSQFYEQLTNHHSDLPDYDWMKNDE